MFELGPSLAQFLMRGRIQTGSRQNEMIQASFPRWVPKLADGFLLDLPDAFSRNGSVPSVVVLAHIRERLGLAVLEPVPQDQDTSLMYGQGGKDVTDDCRDFGVYLARLDAKYV